VVCELTIAIPLTEEVRNIAWDGLALWVHTTGDVFYRIDRLTGQVISSFLNPVGPNVGGMAFGAGSLWVANDDGPDNGTIYELSMAGVVNSSFSFTAGSPSAMAFLGNAIWLPGSNVIERYNLTGVSQGDIPMPGAGNVDTMAGDGTDLWVLINQDARMYGIDTAGTVLDFFDLDTWGSGMAFDGSDFWISYPVQRVRKYRFR
jgi:hypothetical protein